MKKAKKFPLVPAKGFEGLVSRPLGVYANLDENDYHNDEAPSASRLKPLTVGAAYAWSKSPWSYAFQVPETEALITGRAYHKMILEGSEEFHKMFAIPPTKSEHPEALNTADEMKEWLDLNGIKKSGSKAELKERIKENDLDGEVSFWEDIISEWKTENAGKIELKREVFEDIVLAGQICRRHPDIDNIWENSKPEVSIYYISHCGLPMRARMDLMRPGQIVDLKTIANQNQLPFHVACAKEIMNRWYHLAAVIYRESMLAAIQMPDEMWHGFKPEEIAMFKSAAQENLDFRFVFIGKAAPDIYQPILAPEIPIDYPYYPDGTPVKGGPMREPSQIWRSAENAYEILKGKFKKYWLTYGREPWFDAAPPIGLRDSSPGVGSYNLTKDTEIEE